MNLRIILFLIGLPVGGFALAQGVHELIVFPLAAILIIALVVKWSHPEAGSLIMVKLDINKPLGIEDAKHLRATIKTNALSNIYKSFPVVLAYVLFLMFGGNIGHSIDNWIQSLSSIQSLNYGIFIVFGIAMFLGFMVSVTVFWLAIKTLGDMDLTSEELKLLQEQVHVSGDKVCAKYLVAVHDMGRRLLSCEKNIILARISDLKKEEEINNLRNML